MNKELVVFVLMCICHYFADFVFQGQIALYKQKKWWRENYPKKMYKHDWLISLLIHSIMWTLCILIPSMAFGFLNTLGLFIFLLIFNSLFHAFVDHLKCNCFYLNLVMDQVCHVVQIVATFGIIMLCR